MDNIQLNIKGEVCFPQTTRDNVFYSSPKINKLSHIKHLHVTPLVNGVITKSNGHFEKTPNGNVCSESVMVLPYSEVTVKILMPEDLKLKFFYGTNITLPSDNNSYSQQYESVELSDGDSFTFSNINGNNICMYRAMFYYSNKTVDANVIDEMINNGDIQITYHNPYGTIIDRNYEQEKYIHAASIKMNTSTSVKSLPMFTHASDFHGDVYRLQNFLDYNDYLGCKYAVITGDFCAQTSHDDWSYFLEQSLNHNVIPLICPGNHDITNGGQNARFKTDVTSVLANKYNYNISGNVNYYYYDATDIKIRFIAIDQYEVSSYGYNISSTQASWVINTLKSTPSNYGVVILMHQMEVPINKVNESDVFFEVDMAYDDSALHDGLQTGNLLTNIVDAFISKSSKTISVTQSKGGTSYSVTADFSTLNSGVCFIAFASGHTHRDRVGYNSNATNTQLHMNISSTCAILPLQRDLPTNGGHGASQDVFNVCTVDNDTKTINIVRVGASVTHSLKYRDKMAINF